MVSCVCSFDMPLSVVKFFISEVAGVAKENGGLTKVNMRKFDHVSPRQLIVV